MAWGAIGAGTIGGDAMTVSLMSGLMTGFGLPAASVELSASTAAGGGIWSAGAAALPLVAGAAAMPLVAGATGIAGGLWAIKSVDEAGYDGMTSGERLRQQRGGSMRDVYRRAFGYSDFDTPEVPPTMTYGTGVGGDKAVTAQLTGSADVKGEATVTVKVEAGSTLLQVVEQARTSMRLAGTLNTNGPGSLGRSSTDAAAPVMGGRLTPGDAGASRDW